jgi:hypothetical protein
VDSFEDLAHALLELLLQGIMNGRRHGLAAGVTVLDGCRRDARIRSHQNRQWKIVIGRNSATLAEELASR